VKKLNLPNAGSLVETLLFDPEGYRYALITCPTKFWPALLHLLRWQPAFLLGRSSSYSLIFMLQVYFLSYRESIGLKTCCRDVPKDQFPC